MPPKYNKKKDALLSRNAKYISVLPYNDEPIYNILFKYTIRTHCGARKGIRLCKWLCAKQKKMNASEKFFLIGFYFCFME